MAHKINNQVIEFYMQATSFPHVIFTQQPSESKEELKIMQICSLNQLREKNPLKTLVIW